MNSPVDQQLERALLSIDDFTRWMRRRYAESTVSKALKVLRMLKNKGWSFEVLIDRLDEVARMVMDSKEWDIAYKKIIMLNLLRIGTYASAHPGQIREIRELYRHLKRPYRIPRIPSATTALAVLGYIRSRQVRVAYLLALDAGLRLHEMRDLTWDKVDLENKRLIIDEGSKRTEGSILPLSDRLATELRLLKAKSAYGRVITISDRTIAKVLKRARARCAHFPDAEYVNLKNLRHLFATTLYARTRDLAFVQRMMRHRLITTTARYVHLTTSSRTYESRAVSSADKDTILRLLEDGWELLREIRGMVYFRRPREA